MISLQLGTIPDGAVTSPTYDVTMFDKSIKRSEKLARSTMLVSRRETCLESVKRVYPSGKFDRSTMLENYRKVVVRDWKIAENCLFVLCTGVVRGLSTRYNR